MKTKEKQISHFQQSSENQFLRSYLNLPSLEAFRNKISGYVEQLFHIGLLARKEMRCDTHLYRYGVKYEKKIENDLKFLIKGL